MINNIFYSIYFIAHSFVLADYVIEVRINNANHGKISTVFITQEDKIELISNNNGNWVFYKPILKAYDNLSKGTNSIIPITYEVEEIELGKNLNRLIVNKLDPGTYLIGIIDRRFSKIVTATNPLHLTQNNIIQLVVRKEDSYMGFLTELLGLPFIIPPMIVDNFGHQTDLRVGADCAELAIYGRRRMGDNIPYCGPSKIYKYLTEENTLQSGTILHFGYQVSVLYEDRGVLGKLDSDDILIHAFENQVSIQRLGDTSLKDKQCRFYKWKDL